MMSLNLAKCVRYFQRVLIMVPTDQEKYDGSHLSIVYFAILSLSILGCPNIDKTSITSHLDALWTGNGYVSSASYLLRSQQASLSATYFALAIKRMLGVKPFNQEQRDAIIEMVAGCQTNSGQFRNCGLVNSECSLRHTYTAHAITHLLGVKPEWMQKSAEYILTCQNYDGGFGDRPNDESHAGLTFCALASLKISGGIDKVDPLITNYLAKRQTSDGGHNGRPNKPTDVCYSFWVVASLQLLDLSVTSSSGYDIRNYILGPGYDDLLGGFVKAPGSHADPYHTTLALCALSLVGVSPLQSLDPLLTCTYNSVY